MLTVDQIIELESAFWGENLGPPTDTSDCLLRKRGVTVTSLHERVDDTAQGRLMEGFIEVMDEYYSENLAL